VRSRIGYTTAVIFGELAAGSRFGLDIMRNTGLPSGTVYPTLTRAEASGLVRGRWESRATADAEARPRRRYYQLTAAGEAALDEALARFGQFASAARRARGRT
jgi:DNA-binding PadR family transcriptional regulator